VRIKDPKAQLHPQINMILIESEFILVELFITFLDDLGMLSGPV
jgi:hypothetical protein